MLTKKEIEVLKLRKQGFLQTEIASKLKISQPAVSNFRDIYFHGDSGERISIGSVAELALIADQGGDTDGFS